MEMQFTFHDDGQVEIESISILEDLWHDYQFFKTRAVEFEQRPRPADRFLAKRYGRAALLMLVFYVEGVVNRWLKHLLSDAEWTSIERRSLAHKVRAIEQRVPIRSRPLAVFGGVKAIRDALAHLKPGGDLALYDAITAGVLEETEADTVAWLAEAESAVGIVRHPNTPEESRPFREAVGIETFVSTCYTAELRDWKSERSIA